MHLSPDYRVTAIMVYTACVLNIEEMYGISNRARRVRRGCRASQTATLASGFARETILLALAQWPEWGTKSRSECEAE
jgi:hypothetical protein